MPSSPLADSPRTREAGMVAFGRKGTLEWACAQARVGHRRRGSDDADAASLGGAKRKRIPSGQSLNNSLSGRKKAKSFSAGSRAGEPTTESSRLLGLGAKRPTAEQLGRGHERGGKKALLDESDARLGEETEEEDEHEAITPMGSLNGEAVWAVPRRRTTPPPPPQPEKARAKTLDKPEVAPTVTGPDDELMSAALVLCGLGRRG